MKTLLVVYNADSGRFNAILDSVHKMVSPETYPCTLCAITHGPLAMKEVWREFLFGLDMDIRFFHRDDYDNPAGHELPMILIGDELGRTQTLLSAKEIGRIGTVEDLIEEVAARLAARAGNS